MARGACIRVEGFDQSYSQPPSQFREGGLSCASMLEIRLYSRMDSRDQLGKDLLRGKADEDQQDNGDARPRCPPHFLRGVYLPGGDPLGGGGGGAVGC